VLILTLGAWVIAITCDKLNKGGYCHQLTTFHSKTAVLPVNLLLTQADDSLPESKKFALFLM